MSKFNDTYLKPALESLTGNAEFFVKKSHSTINRLNAESDSITKKAAADLSYKQNISTGYKYALILCGIGVFTVLLAWAISIVLIAYKTDSKASQRLVTIEQRLIENNQALTGLAASLPSEDESTSGILAAQSADLELVRANARNNNEEITTELALIREILQTLEIQKKPEITNYSGYALQKFTFSENSIFCHDNKSFKIKCNDTVKFENGWTYSGAWENGMPSGDGSITFPGGAVLDATFKDGQPIEIMKEQVEEKTLLKSITHFHSTDASRINKSFGDVVIGYNFETGADTAWKSAYCYLNATSAGADITISLSRFQSFSSRLSESRYRKSNLYTLAQFNAAKKLCKFKRSGFN